MPRETLTNYGGQPTRYKRTDKSSHFPLPERWYDNARLEQSLNKTRQKPGSEHKRPDGPVCKVLRPHNRTTRTTALERPVVKITGMGGNRNYWLKSLHSKMLLSSQFANFFFTSLIHFEKIIFEQCPLRIVWGSKAGIAVRKAKVNNQASLS